jgi:acetyltransferase-like isoleucine patch superfamily enzyme
MKMPTREAVARNTAEKLFGANMDVSARIYNNADFAPTVKVVRMGEKCFIGSFAFISVPELHMDDGSQINSGTRIVGREPVSIGKNSVISYGCTLITSSDSTEAERMNDASPENERIIRSAPIGIGEHCFVGAHSVIMPGVNITHGIVVRAFAYVNKPLVRANGIFQGQPAYWVKDREFTVPPETDRA